MNTFKLVTVIFFLSVVHCAFANNFNRVVGARAQSLGNNSTTLTDVFAVNNNQAGIGFLKEITFGIAASNQYILNGLNHFNASAVFPTKTGVFGLNLNYFGKSVFNETKIGLAFAKSFGEKFSFGLQFDYLNMRIQEYGSKNLFTFEFGLQFHLISNTLIIGVHVFNPIRVALTEDEKEKIATVMRFGFSYLPSKKLTLLIELEKDIEFDPLVKFGLEYNLVEKFSLRAGFNANPYSGSFGFGIKLKNFNIDVSALFHPRLGVSPGNSFLYAIPKKQ